MPLSLQATFPGRGGKIIYKMKNIYLQIISIFIILGLCIDCQYVSEKKEVTLQDFNKMILKYSTQVCDTNLNLTPEDALVYVKLYNTIYFYELKNSESMYSIYLSDYYQCASKRVQAILETKTGIGMTLYSPKYNISIGGPTFCKGCYYSIKELKNIEIDFFKKNKIK
jgi:hypothetical protein